MGVHALSRHLFTAPILALALALVGGVLPGHGAHSHPGGIPDASADTPALPRIVRGADPARSEPARGSDPARGSLDFRVTRLAGTDRYAAAAAMSREFVRGESAQVVIASGQIYSDGLAAGPLAARLDAPLLFVTRDRIPGATAAELDRLDPSAITIVGGTATIGEGVAAALGAWAPGQVRRVEGPDRFEVAARASALAFPAGIATAYVASGRVWPDGLTGAAAAAVQQSPMLLTEPDALPAATVSELRRLAPQRILLLGGPNSVSSRVAAELAGIAPTERVWGSDRYATALAVSQRIFGTDRPASMLATGANFPDALASSAYATTTRGPILLSRRTTLPSGTAAELDRLGPGTAYLLGGTTSVPVEIARLAQKELGVCWAGSAPTDGRPEIVASLGAARGQLAFTLDMGGRMEGAADIVRYLIDNQVCTTFFPTSIMAQTEQGREVMSLIAAHPHLFEVGNHTVHHCDLVLGGGGSPTSAPCARSMTDAFLTAEIADAADDLEALAGFPTQPYWRPPYGSHDARVRGLAARLGFPKTMMWSRDTMDWDPATTTQEIIDAVTEPTPGAGTIVLAHLGGYHTGEALRTIVPVLRARGLTFTTVSDMWDAS